MSVLYLSIGLLLYAGTLADLIKTTFSSTGGGWVTNSLAKAVWRTFFVISGRQGRSRLLPYAGPTILVVILGAWILGLWLSFFFVLLSDPLSIRHGATGNPADVLEKLYYAAFTLSTLGTGDFVPTSNLWRIATGLAAFSGLAFITASITYFGPVLSAIGHQSRLALYIYSMGATPQQILINSWNGRDFSRFYDRIPDICQMLFQHTLNHHSYPVIHYFHNSKPQFAIAPSVAMLNEVFFMLKGGISEEVATDKLRLSMLEIALVKYLEVLKGNFITSDSFEDEGPQPDLALLKKDGIPLRSFQKGNARYSIQERNHRRQMTSLLKNDGWTWMEVYHQGDD